MLGCEGESVRGRGREGEGDEERVLLNRAILTLLLRFIPLLLFLSILTVALQINRNHELPSSLLLF